MTTPDRELDRAKTALFLHSNGAFYGSLLCNVEFVWNQETERARTDGLTLELNPDWFMSIPAHARKTVVMHEIDHIARMHLLRIGDRDPELWNIACDIRINNTLANDGFSFVGIEDCWIDHSYDHNGDAAEEHIYEQLQQQSTRPNIGPFGDLRPGKPGQAQAVVAAVTQAVQAAQMGAGTIPGNVSSILKTFLTPAIAWKDVLYDFFLEMCSRAHSWKKPNRRYPDIYMPGTVKERDGLTSLAYFMDVSGSVREEDIDRFNTEVKYILEELHPEKLHLVQFDTGIRQVDVFDRGDLFEELHIIGRGGTSLACVHEFIKEKQPTAAIIFSDLECDPMEDPGIPVIWVVVGSYYHTPSFGKIIHI